VTDASGAKQRSVAFIEAAGDGFARSRARALVGDLPVAAVIERIAVSGTAPAIGELLTILAVFDDLGCRGVSPVEIACETLMRTQSRDGSWCDGADAAEDERIFSTGMIAGYLAKTPFVRKSRLDSAADHLASLWEPDRVKGDAWRVTAAYFHCFSLVQHDRADAILQWCGRELERGFRTNVYDVVQTARVFTLCKAHALPGSQLARADIVDRLVEVQSRDGSYAPRDDSSQNARVAHTLDALVALVRLT
jgi:hypothetical protein